MGGVECPCAGHFGRYPTTCAQVCMHTIVNGVVSVNVDVSRIIAETSSCGGSWGERAGALPQVSAVGSDSETLPKIPIVGV